MKGAWHGSKVPRNSPSVAYDYDMGAMYAIIKFLSHTSNGTAEQENNLPKRTIKIKYIRPDAFPKPRQHTKEVVTA